MTILYLGNISGRFGSQPSQMELIIPKLQENHEVQFGSSKKNFLLRAIHFLILILRFHSKADLLIFDVYSSKYFYGIFLSSQMARLLGIPYICVLRGGNLPERLKTNPTLSRLIFKYATKLIAPSDYLRVEFAKAGYSAVVIYNSVEHEFFNECKPKQTIRPKLLYVRSLQDAYNPHMAVQILKELVKLFPDTFLCMAGVSNKKKLNDILEYVKLNGLENNFDYRGNLSKIEWFELSRDYDVYLNTTNVDNTPVSMLEAFNLGMLVASTNVGGIPFIAENDHTAVLFDPRDYMTASVVLRNIFNNQAKAKRICLNGFTYGQRFRLSKVIIDWYNLLDEVEVGMS